MHRPPDSTDPVMQPLDYFKTDEETEEDLAERSNRVLDGFSMAVQSYDAYHKGAN